MDKKIHFTEKAPKPIGPYSQAVESGGFLFCSGQIALDAVSGEVVKGDVGEQTRKVMGNIDAVLTSAGLNFNHVVKTSIFLTSMADFTVVNEIYSKYFRELPPARSTIAVSALPKGVNVEIEVIARLE